VKVQSGLGGKTSIEKNAQKEPLTKGERVRPGSSIGPRKGEKRIGGFAGLNGDPLTGEVSSTNPQPLKEVHKDKRDGQERKPQKKESLRWEESFALRKRCWEVRSYDGKDALRRKSPKGVFDSFEDLLGEEKRFHT